MTVKKFDERRNLIVGETHDKAIEAAIDHWTACAKNAIQDHGAFYVALSGGSTPKKIYEGLLSKKIPWEKVFLFWSDERAVPPDDRESNYHMAMVEANLQKLPIPKTQIFRMVAETAIEKNAIAYEETIKKVLKGRPFDLIMLGMGEDGHTASLFPHTDGLHVVNRLVVANYVPQKKSWRMSFTFECINQAHQTCVYTLGKAKGEMLHRILLTPFNPDELPLQRVGTIDHPALYIIDAEAAETIVNFF